MLIMLHRSDKPQNASPDFGMYSNVRIQVYAHHHHPHAHTQSDEENWVLPVMLHTVF